MSSAFEILGQHGATYANRIADLQVVAGRLPQLEDLDWCNQKFADFGRPDLTMIDRVDLPPLDYVPNPADYMDVGNFAAGFVEYMGTETEVNVGELITTEREKLVPATKEHLVSMVRDNAEAWGVGNASKPAYHRAVCVEPDFMAELTARISEAKEQLPLLGPDVLVAHRIMSRLVDRGDSSAIKADGSVNTHYLCSKQRQS